MVPVEVEELYRIVGAVLDRGNVHEVTSPEIEWAKFMQAMAERDKELAYVKSVLAAHGIEIGNLASRLASREEKIEALQAKLDSIAWALRLRNTAARIRRAPAKVRRLAAGWLGR
jgi:hypothetical protein